MLELWKGRLGCLGKWQWPWRALVEETVSHRGIQGSGLPDCSAEVERMERCARVPGCRLPSHVKPMQA